MTTPDTLASSAARRARPGGRTARTTQAVLRETIDIFVEGGWDAVKIEAVAERAGVHKTTIYRRWPTRGALIAAALAARPHRAPARLNPETGSLRGDLAVLTKGLHAMARDARTQGVLRRLSESSFDPEIAAASRAFWDLNVVQLADILRAGIARGELPENSDVELAATMFIASIKLHVVDAGNTPSLRWYRNLSEATLAAARRETDLGSAD